jgi:DNA repair exonuclease SbcCD ATPase subunit
MRLKLKNFGCHVNATFTIPDTGLVLIDGENGAGKSTLMRAIVYALYGNMRKPYTHGTNTCSVELSSDLLEIIITRTSKPNRLVLKYKNSTYEDESAQGIIDSVMGATAKEFYASSYVEQIIQKTDSSVLAMPPSEQASFVQTLTFSDNDCEEMKKKVKDMINALKEAKIKIDSKIELLKSQCEEKDAKLLAEYSDNYPKGWDMTRVISEIAATNEKISKCLADIEKATEDADTLRDDQKRKDEVYNKIQTLSIEIAQLEELIGKLSAEPNDNEIQELESKLTLLKTEHNHKKAYDSYCEKKKQFDTLYANHFAALKQKLSVIIEEYGFIDDIREQISQLTSQIENITLNSQAELAERKKRAKKVILDTFHEIKDSGIILPSKKTSQVIQFLLDQKIAYEQELESHNQSLDAINEKIITQRIEGNKLKCPKCKSNLHLSNNKLTIKSQTDDHDYSLEKIDAELFKSSAELNIRNIMRWINILQTNIDDYNLKTTIPDVNVDELTEQRANLIRQAEKYDSIQTKINTSTLPTSIQKLKEDLEKVSSLVKKPALDNIDAELNDVEMRYDDLCALKTAHQNYRSEITKKKKTITTIEKSFLKSKAKENTVNLKDVEDYIAQTRKQHTNLTLNLQELLAIKSQLDVKEHYEQQVAELKQMKVTISSTEKRAEEIKTRLLGAMELESACKEAEILAINQTIENINAHAKMYLDLLFTNNEISVELDNMKKMKKDKIKIQMNTTVAYKGDIDISIDDLSGGERQRCNMAFILGVSDMLGGKLLLLDECVNNLSADSNYDTLKCIHDTYIGNSDRLVLVVSHEAERGLFDSIINI